MIRTNNPLALGLVLGATSAFAGDGPVNLLANGGFEEPSLGGTDFVYIEIPG